LALGEIYIKLVVGFPNDAKVRALARFGAPDAGLARDLYVQMCLYCREHLTDGFVPAEQIGLLVYPLDLEHGNQLAKQLASVGLIKELSKPEASGWQVCAFLVRNPTREQVKRLSEVRAEAGRNGGRKSRKRPAQRASQASSKQVANQVGQQTGSNAVSVSVSVVPNGTTDTETSTEQTPTVSAASGLTPTQRSKPITDAYAAAQPMCKWQAINGIVVLAIKSGKYADGEIRDALLRMAESGQTVTVESLRIEIEGFKPRRRTSATDQAVAQAQELKERRRQRDAQAQGPQNVIQGEIVQ
jgi:hypothetical protein